MHKHLTVTLGSEYLHYSGLFVAHPNCKTVETLFFNYALEEQWYPMKMLTEIKALGMPPKSLEDLKNTAIDSANKSS